MKSPLLVAVVIAAAAFVGAASAAGIDMNDPHRAVGRERDVRVDAQLLSAVVRSGSPIAVTYQIENQTAAAVAVAQRVATTSYDPDTRTITLAVGSEIPADGAMPDMTTIGPGEKKVFTAAATLRLALAAGRSALVAAPRFVQIKVSVLRNLEPFAALLRRENHRATPAAVLDDEQFEEWLESNETIFLNALPIRFDARTSNAFDASNQGRRRGSM